MDCQVTLWEVSENLSIADIFAMGNAMDFPFLGFPGFENQANRCGMLYSRRQYLVKRRSENDVDDVLKMLGMVFGKNYLLGVSRETSLGYISGIVRDFDSVYLTLVVEIPVMNGL